MLENDYFIDGYSSKMREEIKQPSITYIPHNFVEYINSCYIFLISIGECSSGVDFSYTWLHKSKNYYAMIKCLSLEASFRVIHNLIKGLESLAQKYYSQNNKQAIYWNILKLIQQGYNLLNKKYLIPS